ncbi:MAG: zf-TFIIB domain-containing protein [Candidatus Aenigmarchaeota archaeon]|nr:zf-TFIIB domain-containing protein [Candidatus Aenigmarchaeota archaeon]
MECPVCNKRMEAREIRGIMTDVCNEHGIWLDRGELEKIMEKIKQEGWGDGFAESLSSWRYGF